jgi:hypothetical protein
MIIHGRLARFFVPKIYDELDELARVTGKASRSKTYSISILGHTIELTATLSSEIIEDAHN